MEQTNAKPDNLRMIGTTLVNLDRLLFASFLDETDEDCATFVFDNGHELRLKVPPATPLIDLFTPSSAV